MRPVKVVVSAFGPYKDRVEIDFSHLGCDGVFLITGDTGSGKTTIFDAICFALYGEASGSKRENSGFRSDFASDNVDTFVELEFVHKDISYRVMRIPRYVRKKKRGEGVTSVGGEASLTYLDEVITGEKNVTEKCVEILGMNVNQFKQVSMIAQGEFLDLLFSKSKDRASIFRHIFNTSIYKNISDKLKDLYLVKRREYEDIAIEVKGYKNTLQLDNGLLGCESTDEVLSLLDKEIKRDSKQEKVLESEKKSLFNEVSRIVKIITEGKIINESIVSLEKSKDRLNELLELKLDIDNKELVIKKNRDIFDLIIPKYYDLVGLKKRYDEKNGLLNDNNNELLSVNREYNELEVKYLNIKNRQNEILECNKVIYELEKKLLVLDDIDRISLELEKLNKSYLYCQLDSKRDILSRIDDLKSKNEEIRELRLKLVELKDDYFKLNELYSKHYDLFLSSQAGILASNLNEGEACPVCGSLEHPKLAGMVKDVLSKEELDIEKRELEDKYKILEEKRIYLLELENSIKLISNDLVNVDEDVLRDEITSLENMCFGFEIDIKDIDIGDLEKDIQRLEVNLIDKRNSLDEFDSRELIVKGIEDNKDIVSRLEEEINSVSSEYDSLLKRKSYLESLNEVIKKDIIKLKEDILKSEADYISCYKGLGYESEDDYNLVKLEKEELLELERNVNEYKEELVSVNSSIISLEKVIDGRDIVSLDSYEEELKGINEKLDSVNLSLKDINNKLSNNRKIYDSLRKVNDKTKELERIVMVYKDLADTANGSITGKNKLEFEQYVQASYFDRVLIMANKRFSMMTDDRYELVRKEESSKISDRLGLELEVMDYYTGKRRGIKSLSGGEAFKAALSLALGMSDTIQEFSGGVVVEAMFIDEGFGSLDDESLNQAMNAIMMLSQGNKMIGIISHVNELKSRIDKKIVVKKSSNGSNVSIVV